MAGEKSQQAQDASKEGREIFTFRKLDWKPKAIEEREQNDFWKKWSLDQHSIIARFSYDQYFQKYQVEHLLMDFFNDPEVQQVVQCATKSGFTPFGKILSIEKKEIMRTVTSMEFFDRLNGEIVRPTGAISKWYDEYVDGVQCSDLLRQALIWEESEHYPVFNEDDRSEFIFHLFKRLSVGGSFCQHEDQIEPYLNMTRNLYKDFVSVQKNAQTKQIEVASFVYEITGMKTEGSDFWHKDSQHNFAYVIIDPIKRHVTYWSQAFLPIF